MATTHGGVVADTIRQGNWLTGQVPLRGVIAAGKVMVMTFADLVARNTALSSEVQRSHEALKIAQLTIDKMKVELAYLRRMKYGRSSERLEHAQLELRAGPAKLNSPMRVDTAPEGEDIARENWSKYEQKTPSHALSGFQGQGGAGRRTWRQDAGRVGAAA